DHEQRYVAMHGVDGKPRPAGRREAHRADDPEHHARGQQHQRNRAGAAREIPIRARAERGGQAETHLAVPTRDADTGKSSPATGHPATWQAVPSTRTRRLGSPSPSSQPTAREPRTIEAVLAMFASRHEAAHTLTVRHTLSTDPPVDGSTR